MTDAEQREADENRKLMRRLDEAAAREQRARDEALRANGFRTEKELLDDVFQAVGGSWFKCWVWA